MLRAFLRLSGDSKDRRKLGIRGEVLAREYLVSRGYRILVTNYKTPRGELDIVAESGKTVVFVEVKTRSGVRFGMPEEAVDMKRRGRMAKAAMQFLSAKRLTGRRARFDIVTVMISEDLAPEVTHIEDAFEIG